MRRLIAGLLIVTCAVVLGCTSDADEPDEDALRARAAAVTDQLAAGQWELVRADFDDTMTDSLSTAQLSEAWGQIVAAKGAYVSRGEPKKVQKPGAAAVFDTPVEFEQGPMKTRVAFGDDGRITGLFILTPDAL